MTIKDFDIPQLLEDAKKSLDEDKNMSSSTRSLINLLLIVVSLLYAKKFKNSRNSSVSPSQDPNRSKKDNTKGKKKSGGQEGHQGNTLERVDNPDEVISLSIDRRTLPKGHEYTKVEPERRQVKDFEVLVKVTEYQAEVLVDENGKRFVAEFPHNVSQAIQYGSNVKANAVYMNCFQMSSLDRIQDNFSDQLNIDLSQGSIYNFSTQAFVALGVFIVWVKAKLLESKVCHADETGINIGGKRKWLHVLCNNKFTYFFPHLKRGCEAIDEMGILPDFKNIICHDHWKPYYNYNCQHSLCNAHHIRELTGVEESEGHNWAKLMREFLLKINENVEKKGGVLSSAQQKKVREKYRTILIAGEEECPQPVKVKGKRGKIKKTKARNLLERLQNFEDDVLLFITDVEVPFTNNQGENDLRMTKVQQKVSGCFRSFEGAHTFAVIRSYINTCKKNGINVTDALKAVFEGNVENILEQIDQNC